MRPWIINTAAVSLLVCVAVLAGACSAQGRGQARGQEPGQKRGEGLGASMPAVIVFHHALGVTPGIEAFADALRAAGYQVRVVDLFEGRTFATIEDGVGHAEQIGFATIIERGVAAVTGVPGVPGAAGAAGVSSATAEQGSIVVIGFSLGVLPAQKLAQTHPQVPGAVLCHSAVDPSMFSERWPDDVAVQLHLVEGDPWAEEDREAARELQRIAGAELHLYPGSGHLVAEPGHADYDPVIAEQIRTRVLEFLAQR